MSTFVLMAGGTGGHLFPAMALAQELRRRGHRIHLMTDERVTSYGGQFPAREVHMVPSATPSIRNPVKFMAAAVRIAAGVLVAFRQLRRVRPDAVVAFGGYPVFPPFVAARLLRIPGILHEQNAVLGRANRALTRFAGGLALSFENTRFAASFKGTPVVTGNPVRDNVREMAQGLQYSAPTRTGPIKVLVFGGSQGARILADLVPQGLTELPAATRKRIHIVQQCRPEDLERVTEAYRKAKISMELASFFEDMPARMADAHLVICRSGASTVAELAVLGRPAILIPLPGALDADQKNNAAFLENAGAGLLVEQATLSPQSLARRLQELFKEPQQLAETARRARALGQPDAVERLADMTERAARK